MRVFQWTQRKHLKEPVQTGDTAAKETRRASAQTSAPKDSPLFWQQWPKASRWEKYRETKALLSKSQQDEEKNGRKRRDVKYK